MLESAERWLRIETQDICLERHVVANHNHRTSTTMAPYLEINGL